MKSSDHIAFSSRTRYLDSFSSQPAFTYLKLTIETLDQGVKYVQS